MDAAEFAQREEVNVLVGEAEITHAALTITGVVGPAAIPPHRSIVGPCHGARIVADQFLSGVFAAGKHDLDQVITNDATCLICLLVTREVARLIGVELDGASVVLDSPVVVAFVGIRKTSVIVCQGILRVEFDGTSAILDSLVVVAIFLRTRCPD